VVKEDFVGHLIQTVTFVTANGITTDPNVNIIERRLNVFLTEVISVHNACRFHVHTHTNPCYSTFISTLLSKNVIKFV